jgi:hypothetical protein
VDIISFCLINFKMVEILIQYSMHESFGYRCAHGLNSPQRLVELVRQRIRLVRRGLAVRVACF